jgi:hypothetical protein
VRVRTGVLSRSLAGVTAFTHAAQRWAASGLDRLDLPDELSTHKDTTLPPGNESDSIDLHFTPSRSFRRALMQVLAVSELCLATEYAGYSVHACNMHGVELYSKFSLLFPLCWHDVSMLWPSEVAVDAFMHAARAWGGGRCLEEEPAQLGVAQRERLTLPPDSGERLTPPPDSGSTSQATHRR